MVHGARTAASAAPTASPNRYRQALELAADLGMRPLAAHCHLGLDNLLRRACKGEASVEHLTAAAATHRALDMRLWLEQAEAEMATLASG